MSLLAVGQVCKVAALAAPVFPWLEGLRLHAQESTQESELAGDHPSFVEYMEKRSRGAHQKLLCASPPGGPQLQQLELRPRPPRPHCQNDGQHGQQQEELWVPGDGRQHLPNEHQRWPEGEDYSHAKAKRQARGLDSVLVEAVADAVAAKVTAQGRGRWVQ